MREHAQAPDATPLSNMHRFGAASTRIEYFTLLTSRQKKVPFNVEEGCKWSEGFEDFSIESVVLTLSPVYILSMSPVYIPLLLQGMSFVQAA